MPSFRISLCEFTNIRTALLRLGGEACGVFSLAAWLLLGLLLVEGAPTQAQTTTLGGQNSYGNSSFGNNNYGNNS